VSTRDRLTVAAALAVALTCASLVPVYDGLGWVLRVLGAVAVVAGGSALARRLRLPRLLEPLAGGAALAAYVCLVFARPTLAFGLLPGSETLRLLGDTIGQGLLDVEELAPPVPTRPGLVLLAVLGVGAIALVVDLLSVAFRRPAVAGLPLMLLFAVPAAVLPGGLGWWPFVLGAAGWLGLLLVDGSETVSRWGTPLRSSGRGPIGADRGPSRVGRRIGAAALGVAVVVPALVPGLDSRLLGGAGGSGLGGSRTTTTYNPILELAGQLRLPEPGRPLLRYTTDDPTPDYLRLTTLDLFDESSGWSSSELSADLQDDAVQDGIPVPSGTSRVRSNRISTTIDLARIDGPWLPTPFPPRRIEVAGAWLWDRESETVFSTRTSLTDLDDPYVVQADRLLPTPSLLRSAAAPPTEIVEGYAQPPALTPYVQQLLDETVAGAETDYDRVAALQSLFRDPANGFRYSEDTSVPGFDQPDALERFLRGQQGFCEQYSSAMAALVRGLGIPARVAVGFTQGSRQADGSYLVTTSDAHAWPEVWFAGAGWIRFEPTPRGQQVNTPGYTTPPVDAPETEGPDTEAAPAPEAPDAAAPADRDAVDRGNDLAPAPGSTDGSGLSDRAASAVLALAGLLAVISAPALLAAARRRRRWAQPGPLTAWAQVRDDAVDVGHTWRPADSPGAAAMRLSSAHALPAPAAAALERLAQGAERARYARPGSGDQPAASALHGDVRVVRSALLAAASPSQRWAARLAPRSTLRWATAALGSATADTLDRLERGVSAVTDRLTRPRRLRRRSAA
jgi:transglutaminase-like putative cysteine protease